VDPVNPNLVYAGTENEGVAKSWNGGDSWERVNSGIPASSVGEVAVDPFSARTVYAGSCPLATSQDGGRTWRQRIDNGVLGCPEALALHPSIPGTLFVGTEEGVFRSVNGARTWSQTGLSGTVVLALSIDPSSPTTLYAGTDGDGVFTSTNSGHTWTQVNNGLTNLVIQALAIDPSSPGTVYAGTFGAGVFKTTNGGNVWAGVNNGLTRPYVQALAIDPSAPATLYAASENPGCATSVFKSTDGGSSWVSTLTLSCTGVGFRALAIDPAAPATVYVGHESLGVYRTTDGGGTWVEFNPGLDNHHIESLAMVLGSSLYAGTSRFGVYRLTGSWGKSALSPPVRRWGAASTRPAGRTRPG
jgi:photosystem II stability/assembly factor-like uncharacterized protein